METLYFLLILIAAFLIYSLFTWLYQKKIVKTLTEEEFIAGYRKAQLIDVREPNEFDNGHIFRSKKYSIITNESATSGSSPGQACLPILPKRDEKRPCCAASAPKRV